MLILISNTNSSQSRISEQWILTQFAASNEQLIVLKFFWQKAEWEIPSDNCSSLWLSWQKIYSSMSLLIIFFDVGDAGGGCVLCLRLRSPNIFDVTRTHCGKHVSKPPRIVFQDSLLWSDLFFTIMQFLAKNLQRSNEKPTQSGCRIACLTQDLSTAVPGSMPLTCCT